MKIKDLQAAAVDEAYKHSFIDAFTQYVENESSGKQSGAHAEDRFLKAEAVARKARDFAITALNLPKE